MKREDILKVVKQELACVKRNDGVNCDRHCENCDLLLPVEEIISAYEAVIQLLQR